MSVSERLIDLLGPTIGGLGYELLGIERRRANETLLLRLYIDSENGIALEDCETVSHHVSGVLEVEQAVRGQYTLEVSSPGLDRPLFTLEQHRKFIGADVQVRLRSLVDGRRKITGRLVDVLNEAIVVELDGQNYELPFHLIERSRLVPVWPDKH